MDDGEVPELLRAAGAGDRAAWVRLVDRFTPLLWAVARSFRLSDSDASDVVQTTWLRLVENLHKVEQPGQVGAWLATTARRECLRTLKGGAREVPSTLESMDRPDVTADGVDSALLAAERGATLWRAFAGLPDRCQQLLRVLMASPPPSYEEVSAVLELPVGSIGPTRGRCLRRLQSLLAVVEAG